MKPPKNYIESYKLEGVNYQLEIEEDAGGFWGAWKCLECKQNGPSTPKCGSKEEAMQGAIRNLGPHHQVMHGLQRKF
ncbi:MAG TPA: hypothetical protein VM008_06250 [Phycisphaerae bacterium]|nr:hypothetical protein [Phycisphaerae bacterium]